MSVHFFARFEPRQGREMQFREELQRVVDPTRLEQGCLSIHAFESLRDPFVFAIPSEWANEEAFELHAQLPHTVRFMEAAKELLTHPIEGLRTRHLAGGPGVAAAG